MKVIALQGETLDAICWRVLGTTDCLESVCKMNPHTLNCPILKEGTIIELPDIVASQPKKPTITLWS